jgi:hypothetical protein
MTEAMIKATLAAATALGEPPQEKHSEIAKAVLEAIRTPTKEMIAAGKIWRSHCSDTDSLFSEMIAVAIHGR